MGYNTQYDIEIIGAKSEAQEVDLIADVIDASGYSVPFNGGGIKWYDHEDDLKTVSALHPEILFKLIGTGEDSEDLWHKYFKGGKMQECRGQVFYDEFAESKLI